MEQPSMGEKIVILAGMISILIVLLRIMIAPGACLPLPDDVDHAFLCFGIHWEDRK